MIYSLGKNIRYVSLALLCYSYNSFSQERIVDCSNLYSIHAAASNYIKEASILLDSAELERKIFLLKAGIDIVGGFYKSDDVIDDSGVTLTLAEVRYSQRQLDEAYSLYSRVLYSRVDMINEILSICKI